MIRQGNATDATLYPPFFNFLLFDPPFNYEKSGYSQRSRHHASSGAWVTAKNTLDDIPAISPEAYPGWWRTICGICAGRLHPSGYFAYKCDDYHKMNIFPITREFFDYKYTLIWVKGAMSVGTNVRKQHEYIEIFRPKNAKKSFVLDPHGFSSIIYCNNLNRGRFGKECQQSHINETPVEVWIPVIEQFCPVGGVIMDPCAGTGSIGRAAQFLNKNYEYHGIEILEKWVSYGNSQLTRYTHKQMRLTELVKG